MSRPWARTVDVGRVNPVRPAWVAFPPLRAADRGEADDAPEPAPASLVFAERLELPCVDDEPDVGLSAHATAAPLESAAPTPNAIANPPTRPTNFDAPMSLPYDVDHN